MWDKHKNQLIKGNYRFMLRDYPLSTDAKFSEKLTFLTT